MTNRTKYLQRWIHCHNQNEEEEKKEYKEEEGEAEEEERKNPDYSHTNITQCCNIQIFTVYCQINKKFQKYLSLWVQFLSVFSTCHHPMLAVTTNKNLHYFYTVSWHNRVM